MSARARSMALARALLERSHQGLDEISCPTAIAALQMPGDDWPATDEAHAAEFATKLKRAADLLRSGDDHCDDADDEVARTE